MAVRRRRRKITQPIKLANVKRAKHGVDPTKVVLTVARSPRVTVQFKRIKRCKSKVVNTPKDLHDLIAKEVKRACDTKDEWIQCAETPRFRELFAELHPDDQAALTERAWDIVDGKNIARNANFIVRWDIQARYASKITNAWFKGKSLNDVLDKQASWCDTVGYAVGYRIIGKATKDLCIEKDVNIDWIYRNVKELYTVGVKPGDREKRCSIFTTQESNSFIIKHKTELRSQQLKNLLRNPKKRIGKGSLNTVWTYTEDGEHSSVKELDNYFEAVCDYFSQWHSVNQSEPVMLNRRFYLIWKFPEYLTPYHQDIHVPPHFTFYNQMSGYSIFHFLPKLVGQYLTWLGGRKGVSPNKVKDALEELDRRGIGSMAVIGPGEFLMILPFGSHGVWVPHVGDNTWCNPFEVSAIRAAEMFLRPIYVQKEKAMMQNDVSWRYMAPIN